MRDMLLYELTREEISHRAQLGCAVVIPLAATEQHGPHLPVYTDSLICDRVITGAVRQASESVELLLTPVLPYGCSDHHLSYGGTISFSPGTYASVLRDIGESLIKDGFRKLIFLNAHGGNTPLMMQAANDLAVHHPVWAAAASYWSLIADGLQKLTMTEACPMPGHAGEFETSAIMAIRPELVRTIRLNKTHDQREWLKSITPGTFIGKHRELTGDDGFTDSPYNASAEAGRANLDVIVSCVANWLVHVVQEMNKGGEA